MHFYSWSFSFFTGNLIHSPPLMWQCLSCVSSHHLWSLRIKSVYLELRYFKVCRNLHEMKLIAIAPFPSPPNNDKTRWGSCSRMFFQSLLYVHSHWTDISDSFPIRSSPLLSTSKTLPVWFWLSNSYKNYSLFFLHLNNKYPLPCSHHFLLKLMKQL